MQLSARTVAASGAVALAIANLGRVPAGTLAGRNAPVTLADGTAALAWSLLAYAVLTGRVRVALDRVMIATLGFVLVAVISTAFAFQRHGLGLDTGFEVVAFLARWILYFGWYPFVAWCLTSDEARGATRDVDRALFAICLFGIFQALFIPEFGTRVAGVTGMPGWEYQGRRLVSSLLDPNFAGALAVLALLPRLAKVAESGSGRAGRDAWLMLVPAAAVVLTASRSSVLALVVGVAAIVAARGLRRPVIRVLGAGAILFLAMLPFVIAYGRSLNKFSIDLSAAQRLVTWRRAFTLFLEHPVLGIGFNATRAAQQAHGWIPIGGADTGFDGGILFVMVLTGVVGAALYLAILGAGVLAARRAWRDPALDEDDRAHASATAASTVAILAHSFFSNSLLLPFVMQVLWIRFGRLAHIAADRRRRFGLAAAGSLVMAVTSCNPCSGVASCTTDYRARLQGAIVDHLTGTPVAGAVLAVTLAGSDGTREFTARTDAEGLWELRVPASCCDRLRASIVVRAPGQEPYVVPAFAAQTFNGAGQAQQVGVWLDRPFARYAVTLVLQKRALLSGAAVGFQQTGGIPLSTVRADAFADANGTFHMELASDRVGNVLGTLTIQHSLLAAPWVMRGFTIPVGYVYEEPRAYELGVYPDHKLGDPRP